MTPDPLKSTTSEVSNEPEQSPAAENGDSRFSEDDMDTEIEVTPGENSDEKPRRKKKKKSEEEGEEEEKRETSEERKERKQKKREKKRAKEEKIQLREMKSGEQENVDPPPYTAHEDDMEETKKKGKKENMKAKMNNLLDAPFRLVAGIIVCVILPFGIYACDVILSVNVIDRETYRSTIISSKNNMSQLPMPQALVGESYHIQGSVLLAIQINSREKDRKKRPLTDEGPSNVEEASDPTPTTFIESEPPTGSINVTTVSTTTTKPSTISPTTPTTPTVSTSTVSNNTNSTEALELALNSTGVVNVTSPTVVPRNTTRRKKLKIAYRKPKESEPPTGPIDVITVSTTTTKPTTILPTTPTTPTVSTSTVSNNTRSTTTKNNLKFVPKKLYEWGFSTKKTATTITPKKSTTTINPEDWKQQGYEFCKGLYYFYKLHIRYANETGSDWLQDESASVYQKEQTLFFMFTIIGFIALLIGLGMRCDVFLSQEWSSFLLVNLFLYSISMAVTVAVFAQESSNGGLRCATCRFTTECNDINPWDYNNHWPEEGSSQWSMVALISFVLKLIDCYAIGIATLTFIVDFKGDLLWVSILKMVGWLLVFPMLIFTPMLGVARYQALPGVSPNDSVSLLAVEVLFYIGIAFWAIGLLALPFFCKWRMCSGSEEDERQEMEDEYE